MDHLNNTINTLPRERGQHLRFEDRCEIKALHKQGYSYRQIAKALNCSPSTVGYELKRGTATKMTHRGRPTEYVASRGQAVYYENRKRSGRKQRMMYQNCLVVKNQSLNKQRTCASLAEVLMNDQISLSYILRLVIGK